MVVLASPKFAVSDSISVLSITRHAAAWRVIDSTEMLSLTANLGDAKTTIVHPATTTHGRLSDEERSQAGISDGLIRVAVGLEDIIDIKADLERGLAAL